jgi:hypothetical protein
MLVFAFARELGATYCNRLGQHGSFAIGSIRFNTTN